MLNNLISLFNNYIVSLYSTICYITENLEVGGWWFSQDEGRENLLAGSRGRFEAVWSEPSVVLGIPSVI